MCVCVSVCVYACMHDVRQCCVCLVACVVQALEELQQLRNSNSRLRDQLAQAESAAHTTALLGDERLKSVRDASDARYDEMQSELRDAQRQLSQLRDELSTAKTSHAREVAQLNAHIAEEIEMRTVLERRLSSAEAQAASEQDVTLTLSNSLTSTSNSLAALQSEMKKVCRTSQYMVVVMVVVYVCMCVTRRFLRVHVPVATKQLKASNIALREQLMRTEATATGLQEEREELHRRLQEAENAASNVLMDNNQLTQRMLDAERTAQQAQREKREATVRVCLPSVRAVATCLAYRVRLVPPPPPPTHTHTAVRG